MSEIHGTSLLSDVSAELRKSEAPVTPCLRDIQGTYPGWLAHTLRPFETRGTPGLPAEVALGEEKRDGSLIIFLAPPLSAPGPCLDLGRSLTATKLQKVFLVGMKAAYTP